MFLGMVKDPATYGALAALAVVLFITFGPSIVVWAIDTFSKDKEKDSPLSTDGFRGTIE